MIIDTDTNCTPHLDVLKDRGVTCVGRYYAARGSWKRLTQVEAQTISNAGLKLFSVYEDNGDPALNSESGRHDAQIALQQARAVGQPEGTAIYFAMEHLPHGYTAEHLPGIKNYFGGIRAVFGKAYKVGCYSDGVVLDELLGTKLIDYAWLSASTSFDGSKQFDREGKWHVAQRKVDLRWQHNPANPKEGFVSADTNDAKDEFGQWALPVEDTSHDHLFEQPAIGDPAPPEAQVASAGSWGKLSDWSFARVNDQVDQGSRLATTIRNAFSFMWKRRVAVATTGGSVATAVSQVPTNSGWGAGMWAWMSAHPLLLATLAVGAVVLVYEVRAHVDFTRIRRFFLTAVGDGRYAPRGGGPNKGA